MFEGPNDINDKSIRHSNNIQVKTFKDTDGRVASLREMKDRKGKRGKEREYMYMHLKNTLI